MRDHLPLAWTITGTVTFQVKVLLSVVCSAWTFVMSTYRQYRVDEAGRAIGPPEYFEATSDKAAVEYACGYEREQDVEVWVASRLVDLIERDRNQPQLRFALAPDHASGRYTTMDVQLPRPAVNRPRIREVLIQAFNWKADMRYEDECRAYAAECQWMAERTRDAREQASWLKLAQLWRVELNEERRRETYAR